MVHIKLQVQIGLPYPQGDNAAAWFHCKINSVVNLLKENYVNVKKNSRSDAAPVPCHL